MEFNCCVSSKIVLSILVELYYQSGKYRRLTDSEDEKNQNLSALAALTESWYRSGI